MSTITAPGTGYVIFRITNIVTEDNIILLLKICINICM